jgi:hypothetical protein
MSVADTIGIVVECVVTADFPDGRPDLPGFPGDGIAWRLLARLPNARSRWCGIRPANHPHQHLGSDRRAASSDQRSAHEGNDR